MPSEHGQRALLLRLRHDFERIAERCQFDRGDPRIADHPHNIAVGAIDRINQALFPAPFPIRKDDP